jgi:hypothetical protein
MKTFYNELMTEQPESNNIATTSDGTEPKYLQA